MDEAQFLICLRTGMTADHLHPMLDNDHDSELLAGAVSILAQGIVPARSRTG